MYTPRINTGGNFCGHDPAHPRFSSTINPYQEESWQKADRDSFGHKRKTSFFYDCDELIQQFYYFPRTIPRLGLIVKTVEKSRKRRSEAREGLARLLSALVHHVELASVNWEKGFARVGYPSKDGFYYYDAKFWGKKSGLSESQVKRMFAKLVDAGYVTRERRWVERNKGQFKALAYMTTLNIDLFREIGKLDALKEVTRYAYEELKAAAHSINVSVGRMLKCAFDAVKPKPASQKPIIPSTAKTITEVLAGQESKSMDYPPSSSYHWAAKLPDHLQTAFVKAYTMLFIDMGTDDPASVYRTAYLSLRSR